MTKIKLIHEPLEYIEQFLSIFKLFKNKLKFTNNKKSKNNFKDILDDEEDEVLINPNLIENAKHKANVEKRKKTATHYQLDNEEIDEFGQVKKPEILAKYDQGLDGDGKKRETFRLGFV